MTATRFSEKQILKVLKEADTGMPVASLCRKHGISSSSFYSWRTKYGSESGSLTFRVKELEDENRRLRKLCQSLQRDARNLQRVLAEI